MIDEPDPDKLYRATHRELLEAMGLAPSATRDEIERRAAELMKESDDGQTRRHRATLL